ncbi:DUF2530 domain-containing protein [Knoellia sp. 3-2P3]|uniref:DUF2530 domain-containing protein n=1 Tax=unclassified Knoellia TaxID=2618719 RepID=UPI0023DB1539|nr:DUF2530 domain-containing protein [Knoellia sp. 3-2P3]MDF2093541.1 DUF2530 domain-containing protein [Knoellia sp. 3-2P3]
MRQSSASRPTNGPTSRSTPQVTEPQPLPWRTTHVVLWGIAIWAVALVVTLAVPALHTGDRSWWPWVCVAGIVLGFLGYGYVRRGRGNASDAR